MALTWLSYMFLSTVLQLHWGTGRMKVKVCEQWNWINSVSRSSTGRIQTWYHKHSRPGLPRLYYLIRVKLLNCEYQQYGISPCSLSRMVLQIYEKKNGFTMDIMTMLGYSQSSNWHWTGFIILLHLKHNLIVPER